VSDHPETGGAYLDNDHLMPCSCLTRQICHWCEVALENITENDLDAWCDWTVPAVTPGFRVHVIGHADCAHGKIGVERA
jgi:hypothetical protein